MFITPRGRDVLFYPDKATFYNPVSMDADHEGGVEAGLLLEAPQAQRLQHLRAVLHTGREAAFNSEGLSAAHWEILTRSGSFD